MTTQEIVRTIQRRFSTVSINSELIEYGEIHITCSDLPDRMVVAFLEATPPPWHVYAVSGGVAEDVDEPLRSVEHLLDIVGKHFQLLGRKRSWE